MLCQKCHKNLGTVRYAEVVDGQVTEQHLCSECLGIYQQEAATGFELSGPTQTNRKAPVERIVREAMRVQRACPGCGIPLSQIVDNGEVGCSTCYKSFGGEIESILEGLHQSLLHKGKIAQLDDARARVQADLQSKRALLRRALQAENYEEAALLRDDLRSLESGLYMSESTAD